SLRLLNAPLASRNCTMFCARVLLRPEMRASKATDAVFTSTPTAFTQSSTTASSERASFSCDTSCWYWPTPMALGSIFTSSASGSCRRRAMETAPRIETSRSGNSLAASSEAEYTEAPASRSEERRVGKEGESDGCPHHEERKVHDR